jgi:hypothetical protein
VKQTLLEIKRRTNVTTKDIAERARLPIADVFVVETGGFSSKEKAQQVLAAFNHLSGMQVALEDIRLQDRGQTMITEKALLHTGADLTPKAKEDRHHG